MNDQLLDAIELATGDNPVASVIWLRGRGADGTEETSRLCGTGQHIQLVARFDLLGSRQCHLIQ